MEETILQGLCEVVERHVGAVVNVAKQPVPTIDLATVRDPVAMGTRQAVIRANRVAKA